VCAIAAGVALSAGGGAHVPAPGTPVQTSPTASASHNAAASKNRVGADALMQPSELPQPGLFQWKLASSRGNQAGGFHFLSCSFDPNHPVPDIRAQTQEFGQYVSAADQSIAEEVVYHYSSAAAARQDYDRFKPGPAGCRDAHEVGTVPNGYAWESAVKGTSSEHRMIVLSGTDVAFWFYQYGGQNGAYDTSDDQAALQRMADRLDGGTPTPDPHTAPPPTALPGSAWLSVTEIPFGTADLSHGWYLMNGQTGRPGAAPATDLCASATGGFVNGKDAGSIVNGTDATDLTRAYHGTPSTTPVYPGSNYLYSSADQDIFTFPSAERAQAAFAYAKQVTGQHSCRFKDGSGEQTSRTVQVGTVTGSGFSLLLKDEPGPSYEHVYFVVKGTHVSTLMVGFEQGDTSTGGDAAVLAAMAEHLP
jgi:hypothetical protein